MQHNAQEEIETKQLGCQFKLRGTVVLILFILAHVYTNTLYVQNTVLDYSRRKFLTWTFSHCSQHTILLISKFNIHMYLVK